MCAFIQIIISYNACAVCYRAHRLFHLRAVNKSCVEIVEIQTTVVERKGQQPKKKLFLSQFQLLFLHKHTDVDLLCGLTSLLESYQKVSGASAHK